jgi:glycosyltransferase involved in cell wall biosynthesis
MKVAYVTADHGIPVFGDKGSSVHVRELVNAIAGLGHEVTVLTGRAGQRGHSLRADVVNVTAPMGTMESLEASSDETAARLAKERRYLEMGDAVLAELLALNAEEPFDFVYERYSLWSAASVRAARQLKIPCVVEVNAPLLIEQRGYRQIVLEEAAESIEAEVFGTAHALVAVSDEVKAYAVSKGAEPSRTFVVPNGVDITRFRPEVAAASLDALGDGFVVGFVGSLKPWHGIEHLLDAFSLLHGEAEDYHLLIVGDGPLRPWIEGYLRGARLTGAATMIGWAQYERLPGLLKRMDVAVAPYPPLDGFYFSPLKLYEYLAMGRPVVASAIGQLCDVIEDGATGLLTKPGDPDDIAAKIARLRRDPGLRDSLGRAAVGCARGCTWDGNARRVLDLAGSLLKAA